jgi:hypothetical protein
LEKKTGADYPFTGWWGRPEVWIWMSLMIELNKNTYDEYLKAVSDSSNYVILATGRVEKLRPQVLKIFE